MKKLAFITLAAVAALLGRGETYLMENENGAKQIDGVRYDEYTVEEISFLADSAWWYTNSTFRQTSLPVHIEDKPAESGGKINVDLNADPNWSAETLEAKIKEKVPVSAQGAFATAVKALSYAIVSKFKTEKLQNQIETMAQTLQATMVGDSAIDFDTFTDSNGVTHKLITKYDENAAGSFLEDRAKLIAGRSYFTAGKSGNVSVPVEYLERERKLATGGGGSSITDAMSITNFYTDTEGPHSNTLALAGWWGRVSVEKPNKDFICDFSLADFGKEPDKRDSNFNKHYLLTRDSTGKMHYLPMTNAVKASVETDFFSITTNNENQLMLYAFTNAMADVSIVELMGVGKDSELYPEKTNMAVVVRKGDAYGNFLSYFPIGDLSLKPDEKSIDISQIGTTSNTLEIAGFAAATNKASETAVGNAFADKLFSATASEILLPVKDGDKIVWLALGNYDINETASGLEASAVSNAQGLVERKFELANWSTVTNFMSTYKSGEETLAAIQWGDEEITTASSNLCVLVKDLQTGELHYVALGQSAADKESLEFATAWRKSAEGELEEIKALQLANWAAISNMDVAIAKVGEGIDLSGFILDPDLNSDFNTNMLFLAKDVATGEMAYVPLGSMPLDTNEFDFITTKDAEGRMSRFITLDKWNEYTNKWDGSTKTIAQYLNDTDVASNLFFIAKNLDTDSLEYINIGNLTQSADGESIIFTNKTDDVKGKTSTNKVYSLYGFAKAQSDYFPVKWSGMVEDGDMDNDDPIISKLNWTNAAFFADNSSLTMSSTGTSSNKLQLAGFDSAEKFGVTLSTLLSTDEDSEESEAQLLDAKTNIMFVARYMSGDDGHGNKTNSVAYLPLGYMATNEPDKKSLNLVVETDDEKGETNIVMEIFGFQNATNEAAGVGESFADKIFSLDPSDLIVPAKQGKDGKMTWIPLANYSITETNSGMNVIVASNRTAQVDRYVTLAHWQDVTNVQSATEIPLSNLILSPEEATNILILAKNVDDGTLNYLRLGRIVTDDRSICLTNVSDEARTYTNGLTEARTYTNGLTIVGFFEAEHGTVPHKKVVEGKYSLEWKKPTPPVDDLTIQMWEKKELLTTNVFLMVNGFADKDAEEKGLDTLLGDTKDTSTENYKFQVLARKMDKDKTLDDSTNGLELVYLDIKDGLLGTNKWRNATNSGNRSDPRSYFDPNATNLTSGTEAVQGVALEAARVVDGVSITTNNSMFAEISGFRNAENGTHPVKRYDGLKWEMEPTVDSQATLDISGTEAIQLRTIEYSDAFLLPTNGVFTLWGFAEASDNAIPYKRKVDWSNSKELGWVSPPDGVTADAPNVLTFDGSTVAWQMKTTGDNDAKLTKKDGGNVIGVKTIEDASGEYSYNGSSNPYDLGGWTNVVTLYGFKDAVNDAIAVKGTTRHSMWDETEYLRWIDPPTELKNMNLWMFAYTNTTDGSGLRWLNFADLFDPRLFENGWLDYENRISIKEFEFAEDGMVPIARVNRIAPDKEYRTIEWGLPVMPDGAAMDEGKAQTKSLQWVNMNRTGIVEVAGFSSASPLAVPYKHIDGNVPTFGWSAPSQTTPEDPQVLTYNGSSIGWMPNSQLTPDPAFLYNFCCAFVTNIGVTVMTNHYVETVNGRHGEVDLPNLTIKRWNPETRDVEQVSYNASLTTELDLTRSLESEWAGTAQSVVVDSYGDKSALFTTDGDNLKITIGDKTYTLTPDP